MRFQSEPTQAWLLYSVGYLGDEEIEEPYTFSDVLVASHELVKELANDEESESRIHMLGSSEAPDAFVIHCTVTRHGTRWAVKTPHVKLSHGNVRIPYECVDEPHYPHVAVTRCVDRLPLANPLHSVLVADDLARVSRELELRMITILGTMATSGCTYLTQTMDELAKTALEIDPNRGH